MSSPHPQSDGDSGWGPSAAMSHMSNLFPGTDFWFWSTDVQHIAINSSPLAPSPDRSVYSRHLLHPGPWFATSSGKVEPSPTGKLTHARFLGDRGKHAESVTRSSIEIAGSVAAGGHFGLNLHTATVRQCPCFRQWVPAGVRKQYSDVINTSELKLGRCSD